MIRSVVCKGISFSFFLKFQLHFHISDVCIFSSSSASVFHFCLCCEIWSSFYGSLAYLNKFKWYRTCGLFLLKAGVERAVEREVYKAVVSWQTGLRLIFGDKKHRLEKPLLFLYLLAYLFSPLAQILCLDISSSVLLKCHL